MVELEGDEGGEAPECPLPHLRQVVVAEVEVLELGHVHEGAVDVHDGVVGDVEGGEFPWGPFTYEVRIGRGRGSRRALRPFYPSLSTTLGLVLSDGMEGLGALAKAADTTRGQLIRYQ